MQSKPHPRSQTVEQETGQGRTQSRYRATSCGHGDHQSDSIRSHGSDTHGHSPLTIRTPRLPSRSPLRRCTSASTPPMNSCLMPHAHQNFSTAMPSGMRARGVRMNTHIYGASIEDRRTRVRPAGASSAYCDRTHRTRNAYCRRPKLLTLSPSSLSLSQQDLALGKDCTEWWRGRRSGGGAGCRRRGRVDLLAL